MCHQISVLKKYFTNFKSAMDISEKKENVTVSVNTTGKRRKIWELEHNYHCAVIGTCLTLSETRKLVSHFVKDVSGMSDYDFHTHAVHMISDNDKPGKKIQNYLDSKYKTTIRKLKKMDRAQLCRQWKLVLKSGDVNDTFWVLITHPKSDLNIIKNAYGDIHMMSHLSGAGNRADLKQLKQLQSERNTLRETSVMWQHRFQSKLVDNEKLRKDIGEQHEKKQKIALDLNHKQSLIETLLDQNSEKKRQQYEVKIDKLKQQINYLNNSKQKLIQKNTDLNRQLQEIIFHFQQQTVKKYPLSAPVRGLNEKNTLYPMTEDNCSDCPFGDAGNKDGLCGRCILYVGGRTQLTPHFKKIVENKEGTFLYHDGGVEQSSQELNNLLGRADLVVFPTDCVSHKAYYQLKKVCKKLQKPYIRLNSSGVSSFSLLIERVIMPSID